MMKVSCKDLGESCDFVAEGSSVDEVKQRLMDHGMSEHREMMEKMTEDEKSQMMMKIDEVLATQG
jgi:predicted small metal-binding protein